jgi:uncharacterized membrane protein YheB (UPF0754 family)
MALLLTPLLGALIGYLTNLLAIAMLFRPHHQKRVGRFVLPFTPGLIPKQRRQLAKKIGEVLGETVLTREALVAAVVSSEAIDSLSHKMGDFVRGFLDDKRSLEQIISESFGISSNELHDKATLKGHELIDRITRIINEDFLQNIGRGKTVGEVLPPGLIAQIEDFLNQRIGDAPRICQNILEHDKWGEFLRQTITKLIKDNTKGLLGLLANPNKIYDSIAKNLLAYLESDDGQEALKGHLDKLVSWLLNLKVDDLPESARQAAAGAIANLADHLKQDGLPEKLAGGLLACNPKQIIPQDIDLSFIRPIIIFLIDKAGDFVAGAIDIPRIVEDKINEMDVAEAERIVISVAGTQLKWIAALGGILGFIIGFIPAILNLLT